MRTRGDRAVSAALALGAVGLSWVLAAGGGAVGVPRTDDWAYLRIAQTLHHTGHIALVGYGQMMLVGLAVWAQPFLWVFGDHRWVLQLSSSFLFAVGVYGGHRIARVLLRPWPAAFVVGSVVAFPGVLRDASSFMTDGPALGLHVLVLAAGVACFRAEPRRRTWWLAAVGLLGAFAFSVRELTLAAPVAVLVTVMWTAGPALRRRAAAVLAVLVVACGAMWAWRHSLPGGEPYAGPPTAVVAALKVVGAVLAVGLGLAPVLALTWRRWWPARHRSARMVGLAVGLGLVAIPVVIQQVRRQHQWWLVGDYIQSNGINGDKLVTGHRPLVLPRFWWDALVTLAVVATVVLAMLVVEWVIDAWTSRRSTPVGARPSRRAEMWSGEPAVEALTARLLLVHDGAYCASLAVAAVGNGNIFDRYLWPLLLSGAIVVAHRFQDWPAVQPAPGVARPGKPERVPAVALAVLAVVGLTALALTANSDAFDGARWRAANAAVELGARPQDVDAGFEWVGTYSPNRHCIWIVSSPLAGAGLHEIATSAWRPLLVGRWVRLHVYRADVEGCPRV